MTFTSKFKTLRNWTHFHLADVKLSLDMLINILSWSYWNRGNIFRVCLNGSTCILKTNCPYIICEYWSSLAGQVISDVDMHLSELQVISTSGVWDLNQHCLLYMQITYKTMSYKTTVHIRWSKETMDWPMLVLASTQRTAYNQYFGWSVLRLTSMLRNTLCDSANQEDMQMKYHMILPTTLP